MKVPYANRTVTVDLPSVEGQPKITVKSIIDDFCQQMPTNFNTLLEAFVLISARQVRVTCKTPLAMEEFCHSGLCFRSSPVTIRPCQSAKWVTISRLSYGILEDVVKAALEPYGKIIQFKMDSYRDVYIGTRTVLMDLAKPIPSRLLIAGHWCNVNYNGQTPTCFSCHKPGHSYKDCPERQPATTLIVHRRVSLNKATNPTAQSNMSNEPTGNSVATIEHVDAAVHAQESNSGSQDRLPEDAQKSSHKDQGSENTDKTKATGHTMDPAIKEMEVTPTPALVGGKRGRTMTTLPMME